MASDRKNSEKYTRILEAAVRVFAKNGFYNSKVSEIAHEASVADGTIYLYFKSKDDILISLFEQNMNLIIEKLGQRLSGITDPLDKIRVYVRSHLEMANEYPDLMEVITVELRQSAKFMKEYDNKQFMRYLKVLSTIIEEGKSAGCFCEDISPQTMTRALFGMIDELALSIVLAPEKDHNVIRMSDQISRLFLNGITCLN